MKTSENIDILAPALVAAMAQIGNVYRDKQGYNYSYADLTQVLGVAKPILAENGLSILQPVCEAPPGFVSVETVLLHVSGQFISSRAVMAVEPSQKMSAPQCEGVAITYLRRYSAAAILGISQEDTDAAPMRDENGNALRRVATNVFGADTKVSSAPASCDLEEQLEKEKKVRAQKALWSAALARYGDPVLPRHENTKHVMLRLAELLESIGFESDPGRLTLAALQATTARLQADG